MCHIDIYLRVIMFINLKKCDIRLLYASIIINMLLIISLLYIIGVKTDICYKLFAKIGLIEYNSAGTRHQIEYRCLEGWANCLNKLNDTIDVVFYGNSITYESNFQRGFPNLKICNLGCNRDNLDDLIFRSFLIKSLRPHKIFILGGINSILDINLEKFEEKYKVLVDTVITQNPDAQLYLQSLLPVNIKKDVGARYERSQDKIKEANEIIKKISQNRGCYYVDLYSAYQVNDSMPQKYTRDGLHLYPEAYSIWEQSIYPYLAE